MTGWWAFVLQKFMSIENFAVNLISDVLCFITETSTWIDSVETSIKTGVFYSRFISYEWYNCISINSHLKNPRRIFRIGNIFACSVVVIRRGKMRIYSRPRDFSSPGSSSYIPGEEARRRIFQYAALSKSERWNTAHFCSESRDFSPFPRWHIRDLNNRVSQWERILDNELLLYRRKVSFVFEEGFFLFSIGFLGA